MKDVEILPISLAEAIPVVSFFFRLGSYFIFAAVPSLRLARVSAPAFSSTSTPDLDSTHLSLDCIQSIRPPCSYLEYPDSTKTVATSLSIVLSRLLRLKLIGLRSAPDFRVRAPRTPDTIPNMRLP